MNAVLAIKPGLLRDGFDALLYSMPSVHLIAHPVDNDAVLDFCDKNPGALAILDFQVNDPMLSIMVPRVKLRCPQGHVVAYLHAESDVQVAEAIGVDLVIREGTRAAAMKTSICKLSAPHGQIGSVK